MRGRLTWIRLQAFALVLCVVTVIALFVADPITSWFKVFRVERVLNSIPHGTSSADLFARMRSIPWVKIVYGGEPACRLRLITRRRSSELSGNDILWTAKLDKDHKLVSFIKEESAWLIVE